MAKTPISILQEFGMKEGFLPEYTIVSEQVVDNVKVFKFQVKYKGLLAVGKALNKKKAKHNAAENMITLMKDLKNNSNIIQILPLKENISETKQIFSLKDSCLKLCSLNTNPKNVDTTNYIGKLQEYCSVNSLLMPEYVVNNVSGEPHQIKFTMACKLGAIVEEATSTTKKQAKQLAAKQLLDRLRNSNALILAGKCDEKAKDNSTQEEDDDILTKSGIRLLELNCNMSENDIKNKYRELTNKNGFNRNPVSRTQDIKNYHYFIKHIICSNISKEEELDTIYHSIKRFKENLSKITTTNDNSIGQLSFDCILKYIKEVLKLDIEKKTIKCKDPLLKAVAYKIKAPIPVVQFGINKNLQIAEALALHNILDTIMIYLN
ncbi:RISC-loading complex subunit tarbp2-like [Polistes fuscatus]|uniref:RISC-loading complex subunit tarbp2-like n=1 Tax=Polistes fuscatus TaxID=30207 RepID=UPI001CA955E8|nr:RISC-loading complex subunit tarbp2-like [Polistes fuscatus]XP_043487369.1 RISC-loading complex subunit tarbp2-like [Polistes fuscatus]